MTETCDVGMVRVTCGRCDRRGCIAPAELALLVGGEEEGRMCRHHGEYFWGKLTEAFDDWKQRLESGAHPKIAFAGAMALVNSWTVDTDDAVR